MTPIYQIHVLHFGDFDEVDYTLVAHHYKPGTNTTVPIYGYLITGENIAPILVDTLVLTTLCELNSRNMATAWTTSVISSTPMFTSTTPAMTTCFRMPRSSSPAER